MENIREAFEIALGKDFVSEMISRLIIIAAVFGAIILIIIAIAIWKSIACRKIKKAILDLSEYPDDAHASAFLESVAHVTSFGKFMAKHSKGFSGLSKTECRTIYNSTVLASSKITAENKNAVRICLTDIGCSGLTDAGSI